MSIDQQRQDQDSVFNLEQYWRIVKKRWIAASMVIATVFGLTVLNTFTTKPLYESKGKLIFTKKDAASSLSSLSATVGDLGGLTNLSNPIDTEAEVIRSDQMAIKVINALDLKDSNGGKISLETFLKNLNLRTIRGTDVMEISYRSTNPQEAANIVNSVIENYLSSNVLNNRAETRSARKFLSQQLPEVEKRVTEAEINLRKFKESNKVVDLKIEAQVGLEALSKLDEAISEGQGQLVTAIATSKALQAKTNLNSQQAVDLNTLSQSPGIQQALIEYQNIQRDLALAKTTYTDNHPTVVGLALKENALKQELKTRLSQTIGNSDLLLAQKLRTMQTSQGDLTGALISSEVQKLALTKKVGEFQKLFISKRNRLDSLPKLEQQQLQLERQLSVAQITYQEFLKQYQVVQVLENQNVGNARIVQDALVPKIPISPKIVLNLLLGGFLGILLGFGTALLLESMDKSIKNIEEAKRILDLPLLGTIPILMMAPRKEPVLTLPSEKQLNINKSPYELMELNTSYSVTNSIEMIQTNLRFSFSDQELKVILVVSSSPKEGKSFVTSNLALTVAKLGRRVLVIDADMRRPTQHKQWGIDNVVGLSSVLSGQSELEISTQEISANIHVLPVGKIPPNPVPLLDSHRMASLIKEARSTYDYVLIDSPPLTLVADALIISKVVDGVVFVVRPGEVESGAVHRAKSLLNQMKAPILGMVINGVSKESSYGGYYYAKDYYGSDDNKVKNI